MPSIYKITNKVNGTKPVIQKDKKGNFIMEFPSLTEASKKTSINLGLIGQVCLGNRKCSGGYIWEYKNINNK